MSGMVRLALIILRKERWQLAAWIGGITLLVLASASAVVTEFADEAARASIIAVAAANPAFLFLRGAPDGTGTGAVFFFQGFGFISVLTGLMATFFIVRNSRAEEDTGRAELVGALPLRRESRLVAPLLVLLAADVLLAGLIAGALVITGIDAAGAVLTGVAAAAVGWVFAGVAAVASQVMPSSRGANGLSAALVGLAFLVRGIGDALGRPSGALTRVESSWPSWFSPIGWAQQVAPFGDRDVGPLFLCIALAGILLVAAVAGVRGRDLGSSFLRERPGAAEATRLRRSATGVAWTLHRPTIVGWAAAAAVLGAIAGALAPTVADAIAGNDRLRQLIARLVPGTGADTIDVFTTGILGICGVLAAAAGVQAVLRARSEETEGRAEQLLATPLARARWLLGHVAVAVASVIAVAVAAGVAAGVAFAATGEGWSRLPSSIAATLAHVPAALILVTATMLVFVLVPRLTVPLSWGILVLALVAGQMGDLLRLPQWLRDLSPFAHSSALPLEALDVPAALVMLAIAGAGAGAATALFRSRDIPA